MHDPYLKRSQSSEYNLYSLRAAWHWWSVRSCCDKQETRCHACLNLSRLRYIYQHCTVAVAQHCPSPIEATYYTKCTWTFNFREYLNVDLKFMVNGCKHVHMYTHISAECSPASVGLAYSGSPQLAHWAINWEPAVFPISWSVRFTYGE